MLSPKDVLIFKLALERGLVDADRLAGALEQFSGSKNAARSLRALGVDGKAVGVLVDEITPTGTNEQGAMLARCDVENVLMGRALTNAKLVTADDLEAAQKVVEEQEAQGSFYGVTEILVEQGKLDVLRAAKLQLRAKSLVATCPKCFQHHLLRASPSGTCSGCGEAIQAGTGTSAVDALRLGSVPETTAREDAILERWAGTDPTVSAMPGQVAAYTPPKPELPTLQPGLPGSGSDRFARAEQSTIAGREQSMIAGEEDASLNMAEAVAQFGAYEILEEVARGASGVVYKARLKEWSRPVALKVLVAGAKASEREVARFQREAEVGREVQHPGLVKVFDSGMHAGYRYIAMEYVEGPTLEEVCVTPLPLGHALEVIGGVCEAVGALHEQGVIHRDLKPSNIILRTKDGKPKLIDLGLVKTKGQDLKLTQTATSIGTPAYMSPEQAQGQSDQVGEATDVYALGAILFFLITAELPVMGENYMDLFRRIVQEDQTPPSKVNPELPASVDALVLKAMAKRPEDRFPTPAVLREAVQALDPDEAPAPAEATPTAPPKPELEEESVGKQLLVVFGLLLGAAAILAIGYALLQR